MEDEEELADAISDETGWCVESFDAELIECFIVSELNNFLEKDSDYWEEEFGCDKLHLVSRYGFGYNSLGKLYYLSVDDITEIKTDKEKLAKEILDNKDDVLKMRTLIQKIFEENE